MTVKTSLYVAGPMRGYERFNFDAFEEATTYLRSVGFTIVSPAEMDLDMGLDPDIANTDDEAGFDIADAMRRDFDTIVNEVRRHHPPPRMGDSPPALGPSGSSPRRAGSACSPTTRTATTTPASTRRRSGTATPASPTSSTASGSRAWPTPSRRSRRRGSSCSSAPNEPLAQEYKEVIGQSGTYRAFAERNESFNLEQQRALSAWQDTPMPGYHAGPRRAGNAHEGRDARAARSLP
jgi:hypothetical protein